MAGAWESLGGQGVRGEGDGKGRRAAGGQAVVAGVRRRFGSRRGGK